MTRAPFRFQLAGLVAAGASLAALAPATAAATPDGTRTFVHSAKSGELEGGRLTLHGVGKNVTWASDDGSGSGSVRIRRLHRVRFGPLMPPLTGTLHIAGHRRGGEPAFKLSRPRYNASRQTVSYRAKPRRKRTVSARAAAAAVPRRFGASSLSMVADEDYCITTLDNNTGHPLILDSADLPAGQTWLTSPGTVNSTMIQPGTAVFYEVDGENCSPTVTWATTDLQPGVGFTASTFFVNGSVEFSCTVSSAGFACDKTQSNIFGVVTWNLHAA
jgi:hypothetical protein